MSFFNSYRRDHRNILPEKTLSVRGEPSELAAAHLGTTIALCTADLLDLPGVGRMVAAEMAQVDDVNPTSEHDRYVAIFISNSGGV